jgi:hypothetical protein
MELPSSVKQTVSLRWWGAVKSGGNEPPQTNSLLYISLAQRKPETIQRSCA